MRMRLGMLNANIAHSNVGGARIPVNGNILTGDGRIQRSTCSVTEMTIDVAID